MSFEINANSPGGENASAEKPITNMRWRPQDSSKTLSILVTISSDGFLKYWHVSSGKCLWSGCPQEDNHLTALDFSCRGSNCATAGSDKIIRVYDEKTKELTRTLKGGADSLPGHSNRIFCVKFDPMDENILYSGGWDKTIQIYDLRQEGPVMSMLGPMITGDSIDVHPGDHYMLTGCYQSQENLKIWDLRTY
jgi:WD40 repeat protein